MPLNELRRGRVGVWVVALVVAVVLAGGAGWALATVLRPAEDPLSATGFTFVSVEPGEVGSSLHLNTVAAWQPVPVGVNRAVGVVTGVAVAPGDEVSAGSVLYTVGLRPVVIAQGEVPAFRAIGSGTVGADVAQLQLMLSQLGFFDGEVDGEAWWSTGEAIADWQESLGLQRTGTVEAGDVIFVPALPTRVSLDAETVARGMSLGGGEEVVLALPSSPVFTVPVTATQANMISTGTQVQIAAPVGGVWEAVTADQVVDEQSQSVIVHLRAPEDGVVCGEECGQIPVIGEARLSSTIVTVPTVVGLVVPSAALVTGASGRVGVIDESGAHHAVTVVSSARGMSVIEGVAQGTRVRVPAAGAE